MHGAGLGGHPPFDAVGYRRCGSGYSKGYSTVRWTRPQRGLIGRCSPVDIGRLRRPV